jgi:hypothetical protein
MILQSIKSDVRTPIILYFFVKFSSEMAKIIEDVIRLQDRISKAVVEKSLYTPIIR